MKEKDLVRACLDALTALKVFHYRNNSGAMTTTYKGKKSFTRFGCPGSPDIIAVIKGRYVGIELKVGYNKQSKLQKEFQAKLEKAGGEYWLIYTIDELLEKL